jgi:hypothetical protein
LRSLIFLFILLLSSSPPPPVPFYASTSGISSGGHTEEEQEEKEEGGRRGGGGAREEEGKEQGEEEEEREEERGERTDGKYVSPQAFMATIQQRVYPARGREMLLEVVDGTQDFRNHYEHFEISIKGLQATHLEKYATHSWRLVRRCDLPSYDQRTQTSWKVEGSEVAPSENTALVRNGRWTLLPVMSDAIKAGRWKTVSFHAAKSLLASHPFPLSPSSAFSFPVCLEW